MKTKLLLLFVLATVCLSCSNDYFTADFFHDITDNVYIAESKEMYDYVKARLIYDNLLSNDSVLWERVYIDDSTYYFMINTEDAYNESKTAKSKLLQKYPDFQDFSFEKQQEIIAMTVKKHVELKKLCDKRVSFFVQTKSNNSDAPQSYRAHDELKAIGKIENNGITKDVKAFVFWSEAFDCCKLDNYKTHETGGFVYSDQSAIWYDPKKIIPNKVTVWEDPCYVNTKPTEFFHYHPAGSLKFSGADSSAGKWLKNACSSMKYITIVTDSIAIKMLL